ncbi:MAG: hypothetical protein ACNS60_13385 [Candidatus Cyclobacteriaceae bacterium M2_1C_046]
MKIKHRLKINLDYDLRNLLNQLSQDLESNYQWQTTIIENTIVWNKVERIYRMIWKPTDFLTNGKIKVNQEYGSKYYLEFKFYPKKPLIGFIIILIAGPILVAINQIFQFNLPNEILKFLVWASPIMAILLAILNYFIFKRIMKFSLNKSISRILYND